jgi:hypothetical protein
MPSTRSLLVRDEYHYLACGDEFLGQDLEPGNVLYLVDTEKRPNRANPTGRINRLSR